MTDLAGVDPARVRAIAEAENARFVAERPRSMELLERARGSMPRGVDMPVEVFAEFLAAVS